jgi:hypothetical protein
MSVRSQLRLDCEVGYFRSMLMYLLHPRRAVNTVSCLLMEEFGTTCLGALKSGQVSIFHPN